MACYRDSFTSVPLWLQFAKAKVLGHMGTERFYYTFSSYSVEIYAIYEQKTVKRIRVCYTNA
jgi:hypothetical protein